MKDNRTWAAAARAMLEFRQYNEIIRWQQDWRSRSVEQSGMVFPLVVALWNRRRIVEAVELEAKNIRVEVNDGPKWRRTISPSVNGSGPAVVNFKTSFPKLAPLKSMRSASGNCSSPSTKCSFVLSRPSAIQPAISRAARP